ncbi:hypothetical protein ACJX0J_020068, partial [Zea mays]
VLIFHLIITFQHMFEEASIIKLWLARHASISAIVGEFEDVSTFVEVLYVSKNIIHAFLFVSILGYVVFGISDAGLVVSILGYVAFGISDAGLFRKREVD